MSHAGSVVVIGGTSGIGKEVARYYAKRDREVVISGRNRERAAAVAREIGGNVRGIALDLTRPREIAGGLTEVGNVESLVITAVERDHNSIREYDSDRATRLVTLKLVGYTEVVHALLARLSAASSIVLFGGLAKERPYPGSTTVTTVNGGIASLIRTMAVELAPIRVNAVHPGIVADSEYWSTKPEATERVRAKTPTGQSVTVQDVVHATVSLLEGASLNGVNLHVDGGWTLV